MKEYLLARDWHPELFEKSSLRSAIYDKIIALIASYNSQQYFSILIGKAQSEQKKIVAEFQNDLFKKLTIELTEIKWELEYKPKHESKDAIDIFGKSENFVVIIELDKHRADQVSKKFISRSALLSDKTIFYIALCYPGTRNMSVKETKKYFKYCRILSEKLENDFAGFIIKSP